MKKIIILFITTISCNVFAQIDSLNYDNHFTKHLTLSDTFFGNEDMYQVCYPKDHRPMFYSIIVFSISTLVLGFLVVYIKNNSNKKLKEKSNIISEQNKDLLDSISYAQRIQQAILPEQSTIDKVLKNGFVFYNPKNIVSGDFYWLHKTDNMAVIILFDCTGHGVPGALLTMLGNDALNKAILERKILDPSLILDCMNNDMKHSLKQKTIGGNQDSLEAGVIVFNEDTKELKYAGANISLTLVQNNVLQIIQAAKCSVGSVQENVIEPPKTHTLQLNTNDCFYLYTDGYADQFGGDKGKKFKYKTLENLLKDNANKSNTEQYSIIKNAFESWKGDLEQVDDVSIIGYKVS